jgi:3-oxoacyl-[acyl-carrier protein] reductase
LETALLKLGLAGKRALVTGASHGIGLAIVEALVAEGVAVALLARDKSRLEQVASRLELSGVTVLTLVADALLEEEISNAWAKVEAAWGGVDILINNVGGGGRWGAEDILETSPEVWGEVYQKNTGVAIQLITLALPWMIAKNWGRVVTVTSIYGEMTGGRPWFNIAKFSQNILMRNLAHRKEVVRANITFNSVAPGAIYIPDTGWEEMQSTNPAEFGNLIESLPLGRMGDPGEVADVVLFVASMRGSLLNGSSIVVDGGESSQVK